MERPKSVGGEWCKRTTKKKCKRMHARSYLYENLVLGVCVCESVEAIENSLLSVVFCLPQPEYSTSNFFVCYSKIKSNFLCFSFMFLVFLPTYKLYVAQ